MNALKKQLALFWNFFKIGLFTFGGGYAMISFISNELVEKRKYVTQSEFADIVTIAESTPGPIAINSATYIGYRVGGVLGSIAASIAVSLPSFIIIYAISVFLPRFLDYEIVNKAFRGIQCAVAVLIISASFKLFKEVKKNLFSYVIIALAAGLLFTFDLLSVNVSTIYFILVGGAMGFAFYYPKVKKQSVASKVTETENMSADSAVIGQNDAKDDSLNIADGTGETEKGDENK